jgi:hypothetical protein
VTQSGASCRTHATVSPWRSLTVGGVGDLALKGARAGPCDDEDKMCCQRERMKKEIKMSPLKLTKSVVIGVFQWKSLDIYYIFFSKKAKSGYNW